MLDHGGREHDGLRMWAIGGFFPCPLPRVMTPGAAGFPAWGIPPNGDLGFELEVTYMAVEG